MKYRTRIYYTEAQKTLMWDRWQKGESLRSIARLFDRHHSSVEGILKQTGVAYGRGRTDDPGACEANPGAIQGKNAPRSSAPRMRSSAAYRRSRNCGPVWPARLLDSLCEPAARLLGILREGS